MASGRRKARMACRATAKRGEAKETEGAAGLPPQRFQENPSQIRFGRMEMAATGTNPGKSAA